VARPLDGTQQPGIAHGDADTVVTHARLLA
jgi:hypothetical protein